MKKLFALICLCATTLINTHTVNATKDAAPIFPAASRTIYGREYDLKGFTLGGAGVYGNPQNDRSMDYVVDAINEAGIHNAMTDYEKIQKINDYLCEKLDYASYAAKENFSYKEDWLPFTDYCLLGDAAVCAGYAEAFQSMCCALGIECWYVTGYVYQKDNADGIYHAWNRVALDGRSYYIDVCWNDGSDNAYFLSEAGWADHEIGQEHETYKISGQAFPMPAYL